MLNHERYLDFCSDLRNINETICCITQTLFTINVIISNNL